MKRILFHLLSSFMTFAFLCVFAQGARAGIGHMKYERADDTTENFDSVSYAYGDIITRYFVELPDSIAPPFELNKENLAELILGFEENLTYLKYSQDTIKNVSFGLGAMQAIFLSDGISQRDSIPYDCILAGLMKVVNHELTLPQDTIKINAYMKGLLEGKNPIDMPDEEKCNFFTYYGIMKGLQPGLQQYIFEQTGKHEDETPADYEAYAAGFAMIIKGTALNVKEESGVKLRPYDYGVMSSYFVLQSMSFHLSEADFLDGCRAAAGLNKRKMSAEESDHIISDILPYYNKEPIIIQEKQTD